jgi:hypothetical protein
MRKVTPPFHRPGKLGPFVERYSGRAFLPLGFAAYIYVRRCKDLALATACVSLRFLVPTLLSCYVLSSVIVDPEEEEGRANRAGEAGHVLDGGTKDCARASSTCCSTCAPSPSWILAPSARAMDNLSPSSTSRQMLRR